MLYDDKEPDSTDVKNTTEIKLVEIDRNLAEPTTMRSTLVHLVYNRNGNNRLDYCIINILYGHTAK